MRDRFEHACRKFNVLLLFDQTHLVDHYDQLSLSTAVHYRIIPVSGDDPRATPPNA